MKMASADHSARVGNDAGRLLYKRIGTFLFGQRLEPDPGTFAFAWRLLHDQDGPLAKAVAALTDGGVRLTRRDIESLVGDAPVPGHHDRSNADGLVAQTQMQVEGFADLVEAMRTETAGFGRDLAASADAMRRFQAAPGGPNDPDVTRITAAMIERAQAAESQLESVTREASELRRKLEEARDNARRDPLTDLPNRRALEEAYAEKLAAGDSICMAMCDVDHFKSVNDRFGHAVGDRVLKSIAESLSQSCANQVVARYGGEEFAILFTGVDIETAAAALDAARATVATKRYRLRETDEPLGEVTFSAGLTRVAPDEGFTTSLQRADRLLYAAKHGGRNRVQEG